MTIFSADMPSQSTLHCPECGYNLHGIASDVCPECGLPIDRSVFAESQLPWSHRKRIGYVRAYLRTLWMALLDSRQLAKEIARPVGYRDAQLFRFITIFIAWLPLAGFAIWARAEVLSRVQIMSFGRAGIPEGLSIWWPWVVGALTPACVPIALAICLLLLSGVASYYFHPKSVSVPLQNRAIALSYYASAPLLLAPVAVALALFATWLRELYNHGLVKFSLATGVGMIAAVFPVIAVAWWWLTTLRLHRRIVHNHGGGSWLLAVTLPVAWVLCVAFALGALIWASGYVVLVIRSFF